MHPSSYEYLKHNILENKKLIKPGKKEEFGSLQVGYVAKSTVRPWRSCLKTKNMGFYAFKIVVIVSDLLHCLH